MNFKKTALGIGAAVLIGVGIAAPHFDRDVYTGTITRTERIVDRDGEGSRYLAWMDLDNGGSRTFQNVDSWLELKFASSDLQGQLNEGERVRLQTYGWRIPILSCYENIVGVERLVESDSTQ